MKTIKTKVDDAQNGTRLDVALSSLQPHLSRRKIHMIIDLGGVYLNRRRVIEPNIAILCEFAMGNVTASVVW